MPHTFPITTIVGVGLLGGSIARGLKTRGLTQEVRGIGSRPVTLEKAFSAGVIDRVSNDWIEAVSGADLIVLCTPPATVIENLDAIRPICGKSTVVTDVASTKAVICAHVRKGWSTPYRFVGSHPMAGSEKSGPEYSDPDLFNGAVTFVETMNEHDTEVHARVVGLWESLGSRVIPVDPDEHDRGVAKTSHAPHVLAALMAFLGERPSDLRPYAGKGFVDATRIAEGRPEIWRDICLTNADALADTLRGVHGDLGDVIRALESRDEETLLKLLKRGADSRATLLDS